MKRNTVWARLSVSGTGQTTVRVVGRFLWWYRVEAVEYTRLGKRRRTLHPGERALVPAWWVQQVRVV
jgi:hypothetical protein